VLAFASVTEAIASSSGRGNSDTSLKALIVSSPTFSHEAVIKEAADNKIAIFTEKPVAETADNILDIFAYTEKAGVLLCCSFQRRFDPSYVAATEAVHAGRIGTPVMSHMFFADHPLPPRQFMLTGGNIFMDLSAHDVDYIMHTLHDHVVSVYATGTSSDAELKAAGVYDNATMVMNFSKGRSHKKNTRGLGRYECAELFFFSKVPVVSVLDYDSSQFYLPPHLFFLHKVQQLRFL
jgi:predicted dehydrogenase